MLRAMTLSAVVAFACAPAGEDLPPEQPALEVPAPCHVGGCSAQICSDAEGVITTCEWRAEYACYRTALCERQGDGACGWTETPELVSCLAAARGDR